MKNSPFRVVLLFFLFYSCSVKEDLPEIDKEVLTWGRNPGLRIKTLHETDITGEGVHIAFIGSSVFQNHKEYAGRLIFHTGDTVQAQHNSAVETAHAGILAGETCGIAPSAVLHIWEDSGEDIIEEITAYNKEKLFDDRIKIIVFPDLRDPGVAANIAEQAGILVVWKGDNILGVNCGLLEDRESYLSYRISGKKPEEKRQISGSILVPLGNRTVPCCDGPEEYTFLSREKAEMALSFYAGVAALGFQAAPEISPSELRRMIYKTGIPLYGGRIINPSDLIKALQEDSSRTRGSDKNPL